MRAQRLCKLIFFCIYGTMEVGLSSRNMEKCHLPWFDLIVHGVNWPLVSPILIVSLHTNCEHGIVSPTLNINPTLVAVPCYFFLNFILPGGL